MGAAVPQEAYIRIMNQCKAKRLMWRMNKSVARDLLPQEPLPVQAQPWHMCRVVTLSAPLTELCCVDIGFPSHLRRVVVLQVTLRRLSV